MIPKRLELDDFAFHGLEYLHYDFLKYQIRIKPVYFNKYLVSFFDILQTKEIIKKCFVGDINDALIVANEFYANYKKKK